MPAEKLSEPIFLQERTRRVYAQQDAEHRALTDRLFAVLAVVMWTATLALYCVTIRPDLVSTAGVVATVAGLLAAGVAFVAVPVCCTVRYSGNRFNPYLAAISLAVCSVLFVRVSGRNDSELAVFVMLAFLAFYRSGAVLVVATAVVIGELIFRTMTERGASFSARTEDVAWILIFDLVLYASISRMSQGLKRGSAQQATLEALSEESQIIKTVVFEAAPDAVIRYDRNLTIIEINPVAEHMLKIGRVEAVGRLLTEFIPDYDPSTVEAPADAGGTSQLERFFEGKAVCADGAEFIAECFSSEVPGLAEKQFAVFVRDITSRKALENHLAQARKLESIGQLAAGIAHEINTPTQYVGDNTLFLNDAFEDVTSLLDAYEHLESLVRDEAKFEKPLEELDEVKDTADLVYLRAEIPKSIKESLDGIDRISVIVRALKDFSHPGVEAMTAGDINRIVESTVTVARNEWKYVAELELDLCPSLPPIFCLPGELGQVILNLIVNSSHAIADQMAGTGAKGLIKISTRTDGEYVSIHIEDNGVGIPNGVQDKVFDPFFTTKEVGKGTGQGLSIAYNVVVERHKGRLRFESKEGVGTTFIVTLPMDVAEPGETCRTAA